VVSDADRVRVILPDGQTFDDAEVVGRDPTRDLAVVKVDGNNLPTVPVGNSSDLQMGAWVIAIGNALGEGPTVTVGVASAFDRTVPEPNGCTIQNMIQTDAAINPGNSGGPLFNLAGQVVGINTAVQRSTTSGVPVEGVGYAIAIDGAKPVIQELIERGEIVRPYLGISYLPVTPSVASYYGLPVEEGALIMTVVQGSPAAEAGLQRGMIIQRIGNTAIATSEDLAQAVSQHTVGDQVTVSGVTADGQDFSVQVTLGRHPLICQP
jgi:S1-C subfamily serine protease